MPDFSRYDALIFDCDGTLVDTPPLYARAWAAGFAPFGVEITPQWYRVRAGLSEHVLIDAVEREFGVQVDRLRVGRETRAAFAAELHRLREIAPIARIARQAHGRQKLAVASGGPREVVLACLKNCGLDHLFDAIVTVEDAKHPKPAPDLFVEAARRLATAPARCAVFEDSPEGLAAARAAGMDGFDIATLL